MRLGPYEVLEELGRGGVGVVYRARAPGGGEVAVKLVASRNAETTARFGREVRLLASLGEEQGFVPLIDAGSLPGGMFLAMPLLTGGTLRARLERGALPVAEARALGIALGEALGRAHAAGIVHRDVKPENVLHDAHGKALLADLGLAKHFDSAAHGASGSVQLTAAGASRGTAGYMAPEQMDGAHEIGPPADVFALGATIYECLAGAPAFPGDTLVEVLARVMSGGPAPLERHGVPPALAREVTRALARSPDERHVDGLAFAHALAGRTDTRVDSSSRRSTRADSIETVARTRRTPLVALAVTALVALGVTAFLLARPPVAPPPVAPPPPAAPAPDPAAAKKKAAVARIYQLEEVALRLDSLGNGHARTYKETYLALASAYDEAGRREEALRTLERALRLDSWNLAAQRRVLELQLELHHDAEAYRRAEFTIRVLSHHEGSESLVSRAREIVALLEKKGVRLSPRPMLPEKKLLVFGFEGTDPVLVETVSSRIRSEFGMQVEVLDDHPEALETGRHDRHAKLLTLAAQLGIDGRGEDDAALERVVRERLARVRPDWVPQLENLLAPQLDCATLVRQGVDVAGERLKGPGVVGVLGITDRDMTQGSYNFLFGMGLPGSAVMSYARFMDPRHETLVKRAVMQGFSCTIKVLGVPRCSTASCATAYPNSLEEMDRKVDELCPECLAHLAELR